MAVGFFLLIVPGIWLAVAFSVAVPALLLERIGPFAAMGRSFRLVRGRWWATFGTLLVGYVLVGAHRRARAGARDGDPEPDRGREHAGRRVSSVVGGTLGAVLTTPYSAAVIALIYFDLRVRKEGLDLQLIADGAGVERDPDAPLPAPFAAGSTRRARAERGALLVAAAGARAGAAGLAAAGDAAVAPGARAPDVVRLAPAARSRPAAAR